MPSPNGQAITALEYIYADQVSYFNKDLSRDQVIEREAKFLARWPIRVYKPKNGQIFVSCDASALICSASGVLEFDARSLARNQRSVGEATFRYRLQFSAQGEYPPKVILEHGTVLNRNVQPLSGIGEGTPQ